MPLSPNGYHQVGMSKAGVGRQWYVHRLVAMAFLGVPQIPKMVVNHKNGIKTDNRPKNLEWVSQSDNIRHAIRKGLQKHIGWISPMSQKALKKGLIKNNSVAHLLKI